MIFVDRAMSKVMEPIKMNATFMKKSITWFLLLSRK
jgi:hypothetical protein